MLNRYGIGVRIGGEDGVDIGPWVIVGGRIERGRQDVLEQPQPDLLSLTLFTRDGYPQDPRAWFEYGVGDNTTAASHFTPDHDTEDTYLGPLAWIGIDSLIWVSLTTDSHFTPGHDTEDVYGGAEYRRFTGKVNAIDYEYERIHIQAVSGLEAWAHVGLGEDPGGQPTDPSEVDQVEWLADSVPSPTTLHISGTAGVNMLEYTDDDFPLCLLDELQRIAADADGLVYATREGNVTYQTKNHTPVTYVLPAGIVDVDALGMSLELGSHKNRVTVEYGVPPDEGDPRPTETHDNTASITAYGVRGVFVSTQISSGADADDHALTLLNRHALEWAVPDLSLRMILADDAQCEDIAALDLGDNVELSGLPAGAPFYEFGATIIGYTETLTSMDWEIEFHLGNRYEIETGS